MKKRGFTLVELLAAITLLALITMLISTTVVGFFKKGKEDLYKDQLTNIKLAAKTWASDNKDKVQECYVVTLKELQKDNYIDDNIKDPRTDEILDSTSIMIKIEKEGSKYNYTLSDEEKLKCKKENSENKGYEIGDKVIVHGEHYYIISASNGYFTLLKAEPLTVTEVNKYGEGHINRLNEAPWGNYTNQVYDNNGYGGTAYFSSDKCGWKNMTTVEDECTTDYNQSDVKYIVDNWKDAKFAENELALDNSGYKARLITVDELQNLGCDVSMSGSYANVDKIPNWIWNSNYYYWTMTPYDSTTAIRNVDYMGGVGVYDIFDNYGVVRPVINIYKSSLNNKEA